MTKEDFNKQYKDVIKNDGDFDGRFLLYLIERKVELMEKYFRENGISETSTKEADYMKDTLKIIKMLYQNEKSEWYTPDNYMKDLLYQEKDRFKTKMLQERVEKEELLDKIFQRLRVIVDMWD